jgi:hypothetical protein
VHHPEFLPLPGKRICHGEIEFAPEHHQRRRKEPPLDRDDGQHHQHQSHRKLALSRAEEDEEKQAPAESELHPFPGFERRAVLLGDLVAKQGARVGAEWPDLQGCLRSVLHQHPVDGTETVGGKPRHQHAASQPHANEEAH